MSNSNFPLQTDTSLNPVVSVITIVYNGEKYLGQAIESVLHQTYPNIEYLVIDGASKDGSVGIIKKYESKLAYWVSEKDEGQVDAMNKGAMRATGRYVLYLHADDVLEADAVEQLVSGLRSSGNAWAMGFYKYINSQSAIMREDQPRHLSFFDMQLRNIVRHQATIVPREVFSQIKFERKYKYAMDYMFFLRVWDLLGPPVIVKKHLAQFRFDGTNLSSNFYASIKDEMQVRKDYRKQKKERYKLAFDYVIYYLRLLKIYAYHSRVQNVG